MLKTTSGHAVHPIGIGTWNIASRKNPDAVTTKYEGVEPVHGNEETEIEAIRYSISRGQNHLDCAEYYGAFYTDEVVGRAIVGLTREDLFIADKLWKTSLPKDKVRPAVELMLKKFDTDYLDLLYIHWPFDAWHEAIPQIDKLIDEGIVRHFGISNFNLEQMKEATQLAKHPIAASQMRFNVLDKTEVDQAYRDFCRQHAIQIVAYQPIKRNEVLADKTVRAIAAEHNATPSQVALAWLIQVGALPIPKAINQTHIDDNLKAVNLTLSDTEIKTLEEL